MCNSIVCNSKQHEKTVVVTIRVKTYYIMNWQMTIIIMMQKLRHIIFEPEVKVMKNTSLGKATSLTSVLEERVGNIGWCQCQL